MTNFFDLLSSKDRKNNLISSVIVLALEADERIKEEYEFISNNIDFDYRSDRNHSFMKRFEANRIVDFYTTPDVRCLSNSDNEDIFFSYLNSLSNQLKNRSDWHPIKYMSDNNANLFTSSIKDNPSIILYVMEALSLFVTQDNNNEAWSMAFFPLPYVGNTVTKSGVVDWSRYLKKVVPITIGFEVTFTLRQINNGLGEYRFELLTHTKRTDTAKVKVIFEDKNQLKYISSTEVKKHNDEINKTIERLEKSIPIMKELGYPYSPTHDDYFRYLKTRFEYMEIKQLALNCKIYMHEIFDLFIPSPLK